MAMASVTNHAVQTALMSTARPHNRQPQAMARVQQLCRLLSQSLLPPIFLRVGHVRCPGMATISAMKDADATTSTVSACMLFCSVQLSYLHAFQVL